MLLSLQTILLWALISGSAASFAVFLLLRKSIGTSAVGKALVVLNLLIALSVLVVRIVYIGRLPFTSGLDFGFWFNVAILAILAFMTWKMNLAVTGIVIFPVVTALTAWMAGLNMEAQSEMPALKSYWLDFHVSSAIVAYGAFTISFALSLLLMVSLAKGEIKMLPSAERLTDWSYRSALVGVTFQTIMLITGAVWAEYAWGSYWSWDPKETWALITWLIYAGYLHLRLQGWSEKRLAIVNIVGFLAMIFTFFGVSYLLPGMHSYL